MEKPKVYKKRASNSFSLKKNTIEMSTLFVVGNICKVYSLYHKKSYFSEKTRQKWLEIDKVNCVNEVEDSWANTKIRRTKVIMKMFSQQYANFWSVLSNYDNYIYF